MAGAVGTLNEAFGWLWIGLGFASGAALGMGFARDGFLGGYGSWTRRLVRLGHISLVALGALNILFALSLPRIAAPDPWPVVASWSMAAGSILMPACCGIVACKRGAVPLFAIPVVLLSLGATVAWVGLVLGWRAS
jgi:hypothetical protein